MTHAYQPEIENRKHAIERKQRWLKGDRYYVCLLQQDLFAAWTLTRSWGSMLSQRGREMTESFSSYEEGIQKLQSIAKRRCTRGYEEVQACSKNPT